MLVDRFGIFEAAASASITLSRLDADGEVDLPMETAVAEAVMEFGTELRAAFQTVRESAGGVRHAITFTCATTPTFSR